MTLLCMLHAVQCCRDHDSFNGDYVKMTSFDQLQMDVFSRSSVQTLGDNMFNSVKQRERLFVMQYRLYYKMQKRLQVSAG